MVNGKSARMSTDGYFAKIKQFRHFLTVNWRFCVEIGGQGGTRTISFLHTESYVYPQDIQNVPPRIPPKSGVMFLATLVSRITSLHFCCNRRCYMLTVGARICLDVQLSVLSEKMKSDAIRKWTGSGHISHHRPKELKLHLKQFALTFHSTRPTHLAPLECTWCLWPIHCQ